MNIFLRIILFVFIHIYTAAGFEFFNESSAIEKFCLSPAVNINNNLFTDKFSELVSRKGICRTGKKSENPITEGLTQTFFTFYEYMQECLYNKMWGYYYTGKVKFRKGGHFSTYPVMLSPYFGHMIAEQAFRMWQGMRGAGTLKKGETFYILEFGGGDGTLAFDTLNYIKDKADKNEQWSLFWKQMNYTLGEYSPELQQIQFKKNKIYAEKFQSKLVDARYLENYFAKNSIKGLIFSNELLDAFPVHKVRLYKDGTAKAAISIPAIPKRDFVNAIGNDERQFINLKKLEEEDRIFREKFGLDDERVLYLSKESFMRIKESCITDDAYLKDFRFAVHYLFDQFVSFTERYIDAGQIEGVAEVIQENMQEMKNTVMNSNREFEIVYVNMSAADFIKGVGKILDKGYCMTIDFGDTAAKVVYSSDSLRTYNKFRVNYDPYELPGRIDMMSIVDYTMLDQVGCRAHLNTEFFGGVDALLQQTGVNLESKDSFEKIVSNMKELGFGKENIAEKMALVTITNFVRSLHQLNIMVQQKQGTDENYTFAKGARKLREIMPEDTSKKISKQLFDNYRVFEQAI
ncbi:MAG: SAM-dependent methyltransferase [Candidatus Omnitrophica bacterium]|nr:SAM-dependent methyltransferase [Candidatus Omnitrophota bacterium]MBU4478667.1 SAM-dependent methyltransferase [Candidatus Omnitrophota bacterium]